MIQKMKLAIAKASLIVALGWRMIVGMVTGR
jgi:hypothetical protein